MSNDPVLSDLAVVNASPLIVLFKSGLERILPGLFRQIVVPDAVWAEVVACDDLASKGLADVNWLNYKEKIRIPNRILFWNLGIGESEVLSWSLEHKAHIAVIDDLAARKCSSVLDIRHVGTAGLLVLAYRHGLVSSLETAFSAVQRAGLYLTDDLVNNLIKIEKQ